MDPQYGRGNLYQLLGFLRGGGCRLGLAGAKNTGVASSFFGFVSRAGIGAGDLLASGVEGVAAGSSRGGSVARRGGVTKCQSDLQPCGCSHTFASAWNRGGRA